MIVPPSVDISNLDINSIDVNALDFGTELQDYALIANTFERASHTIPTEAAVFAPLSRSLDNTQSFSEAATTSLNSYLVAPQTNADESVKQAAMFGSSFQQGTQSPINTDLQSLNIGDTFNSIKSAGSFGDALFKFARDCIPCTDRLLAFIEMHPNVNLLAVLEADLKARLLHIANIGKMLKNLDINSDLCKLLELLSFMCIPDLQRIIATIMALFLMENGELDLLIGVLQIVIAPIFTPILMAITSLLDQFNLMVTSPLDCVIDAINQQLKKLNYQLNPDNPLQALNTGLAELNKAIQDGKKKIQDRLAFYIEQIKAMLGELTIGDGAYLEISLRKLKYVRLIALVIAVISAITKGQLECGQKGENISDSELDNFLNNFLNPNNGFSLWIDENGQLNVDEKQEVLPTTENVFQFEGDKLIDKTTIQLFKDAQEALFSPTRVIIPCRLKTNLQDVDQVNTWIEELSKV